MTDTFGLFGSIFCDFGDEFEVSDVNGEDPMTSLLSSVFRKAGMVAFNGCPVTAV